MVLSGPPFDPGPALTRSSASRFIAPARRQRAIDGAGNRLADALTGPARFDPNTPNNASQSR
jgi:hypothetical protein